MLKNDYPVRRLSVALRSFFGLLVLMVIIGSQAALSARDASWLQQQEDSLRNLSLSIVDPLLDSQRLERNARFTQYFREVLLQDSLLQWPFDSLKTVGIQNAPNNSFRIITWYVPLVDGTFRYFGFVQRAASAQQAQEIFPLTDATPLIDRPGLQISGADNWLGAWYYELIHNRHQGRDLYILLGWKGKDGQSRQRLIEPFELTDQGPVFGADVFDTGASAFSRIIFEYSARVTMSLKYESHPPKPGQAARPMIVFDRLAPTHQSLQGHFRHYVPEVNIFDGFVFDQGRWRFIPDVDARSARR